MTLYQDVGPFAREVVAQIENMIAELGPGVIEPPARVGPESAALAV